MTFAPLEMRGDFEAPVQRSTPAARRSCVTRSPSNHPPAWRAAQSLGRIAAAAITIPVRIAARRSTPRAYVGGVCRIPRMLSIASLHLEGGKMKRVVMTLALALLSLAAAANDGFFEGA